MVETHALIPEATFSATSRVPLARPQSLVNGWHRRAAVARQTVLTVGDYKRAWTHTTMATMRPHCVSGDRSRNRGMRGAGQPGCDVRQRTRCPPGRRRSSPVVPSRCGTGICVGAGQPGCDVRKRTGCHPRRRRSCPVVPSRCGTGGCGRAVQPGCDVQQRTRCPPGRRRSSPVVPSRCGTGDCDAQANLG